MGTPSKLLNRIWKKGGDQDMLDGICNDKRAELSEKISYSQKLRKRCQRDLVEGTGNFKDKIKIVRETLLFEAPYVLDSYLLYLEIDRKPEAQFYRPRRKVLKQVVDGLQKMVDDELDELFISMPPRTGKTTLVNMFMTWVMGRNPEQTNLYSAYSSNITKMFYEGVKEIITDSTTYNYAKIFKIALPETLKDNLHVNGETTTVDLGRLKKYKTLTCRSIESTLNGACDCGGFLVGDDLVGDVEEAMNKDRLVKLWARVDNNLIPRMQGNAKIIWIGTRWSKNDPIGIRHNLVTSDPAYESMRVLSIELPALNENNESNFNYKYVGFTTDFYLKRKASFEKNEDFPSWSAQYMCKPIDREGTLFCRENMLFYNGNLPDRKPDVVYMACDPAFGGGDFLSAPVVYQYGDTGYVDDWIFSDADKTITQPLMVECILRNKVQILDSEENNGGGFYIDDIERKLRLRKKRLNIIKHYASTKKSKNARIIEKAPEIRELIFRDSGCRSTMYDRAMQNVYSFSFLAKNTHDDAPDSLAMICNMQVHCSKKQYEIFKRDF